MPLRCEERLQEEGPQGGTIDLRCQYDWGHAGDHANGRRRWPNEQPNEQLRIGGGPLTIADDLYDEVMHRRPRCYVDRLMCHSRTRCGDCWWCREGQSGRFIVGTGRVTDLTHGSRKATTIIEPTPYPFREEEFARPWLARCFAHGRKPSGMAAKRVPWQKRALAHLDLLPPRYFAGGRQDGEWAYVDLIQAYPSIYSRLALDVTWRPDPDRPRLGVGRMAMDFAPELRDAKDMHRAVGGILRSRKLTQYVDGRASQLDTTGWSKFLAPDLWGVIMWTLHGIARMAIDEFDCVMWDTDGGVVPMDRAGALMEATSDRWGLTSRVEHRGSGTVWGVKHWEIGDDRTKQGGPRRVLAADERVLRPSAAIVRCLEVAALEAERDEWRATYNQLFDDIAPTKTRLVAIDHQDPKEGTK